MLKGKSTHHSVIHCFPGLDGGGRCQVQDESWEEKISITVTEHLMRRMIEIVCECYLLPGVQAVLLKTPRHLTQSLNSRCLSSGSFVLATPGNLFFFFPIGSLNGLNNSDHLSEV